MPVYLNLTEAGERIRKSRTTVRRMVEDGVLAAMVDPDSDRLVIDEAECERYLSSFSRYTPQKAEVSQPSHAD